MEYQGRIYKIFPTISGTSAQTGNAWQRQDFVFEFFERPEDTWSQRVLLNIRNDRIAEYDLHENDEVGISFTHSVREWNGKYFNEVNVRSLRKTKAAPKEEPHSATPTPTPQPEQPVPVPEQTDDLPF